MEFKIHKNKKNNQLILNISRKELAKFGIKEPKKVRLSKKNFLS